LRHGWPVTALLVLYPLWWVLGMGTLIVFVLMVPMVVHLCRRPVKVPPGFGLWLLFLVWAVASVALVGFDPPPVLAQTVSVRMISVFYTLVSYLAATIVLLYIGNLTEEEFPRQRLVRQLGAFFCIVVAGGLLGMLAPQLQFTSPVELLLPGSVRTNGFVQSLVHPVAAQVSDILGYSSPRPAAPFGYTNMWGNCLALLLGWFVVGWLLRGNSPRRRILGAVVLAVAALPVVYSLNRGLWVGLGIAMIFLLARLAARGHLAPIAAVIAVVVVAGVVVVASPLSTLVQDRLAHGQSNSARAFTTVKTLDVMSYSPVLGFGSQRMPLGSSNSITAGPSPGCPRCGSPPLGSNGQLWAVLIAHGFGGVLLFFGFFIRSFWAFRRDRTPIGDAGLISIVLSLWFMFVYNAVTIPLVLSFLSIALLWRNQQQAAGAAKVDGVPELARTGLDRRSWASTR
jgi:hypothetical protein